MIEDMKSRTKGKYLTQGVSFNKTCPRQMDLLKKSLMASVSFSGLAKEMLAQRFDGKQIISTQNQGVGEIPTPKAKNVGNFI